MVSSGAHKPISASPCLILALCVMGTEGVMNERRMKVLLSAALWELRQSSCIAISRKRVLVVRPLPQEASYLYPLYETLRRAHTIALKQLFAMYTQRPLAPAAKRLLHGMYGCLQSTGSASLRPNDWFCMKTHYQANDAKRRVLAKTLYRRLLQKTPAPRDQVLLWVLGEAHALHLLFPYPFCPVLYLRRRWLMARFVSASPAFQALRQLFQAAELA